MALTGEQVARLHQEIDDLASERPDVLEAIAKFLKAVLEDDEMPPGPDDAGEPTPLTPAGCAA